jgi:hypothetical protein
MQKILLREAFHKDLEEFKMKGFFGLKRIEMYDDELTFLSDKSRSSSSKCPVSPSATSC